jgi:hypothetical protein
MWQIFAGWESIDSAGVGESEEYLLEFIDEPMLLRRVTGDSAGDSGRESSAPKRDTGSQSLGSVPSSDSSNS